MQWKIKSKIKNRKRQERRQEIIKSILRNRGIVGKKEIESFLHPIRPDKIKPGEVGIDKKELVKAITRIKKAKNKGEKVIVYGDYDADGICSTAILWETLYALGVDAIPFIPNRQKHGYGLSKKGLKDVLKRSGSKSQESDAVKTGNKPSLVITVDNGIVAHQAVDWANEHAIDVIISDHHQKESKLPNAQAVVHTIELAGAGVAWVFANSILQSYKGKTGKGITARSFLDLATIGTVADMVPLTGVNRSLVKYGLKNLKSTQRTGLLELFKQAGIKASEVEIYHINFVIAPRLNATGRLSNALDSLRLLCTPKKDRARALAIKLQSTNRERQELTEEMLLLAKNIYHSQKQSQETDKIVIIDHQEFHEGVIGLIAGKITEELNRPAIILSRDLKVSKASARSVSGFNIIQAIRQSQSLLIDAGGHPMAAGFTIETKKIESFKRKMFKIADQMLDYDDLEPSINIDCQIDFGDINWKLMPEIEKLEPFGIGNPRPRFVLRNAEVSQKRAVGSQRKHLKLTLSEGKKKLSAIGFNFGFMASKIGTDDHLDLAFTLEKNAWNGRLELQLKVKDIKKTEIFS